MTRRVLIALSVLSLFAASALAAYNGVTAHWTDLAVNAGTVAVLLWVLGRLMRVPAAAPVSTTPVATTPVVALLTAARDAMRPEPAMPDTFGFRSWLWDLDAHELYSPAWSTHWPTPELRCENFDEAPQSNGAGIYAHLVPAEWRTARPPYANDGRAFVCWLHGGFRPVIPVAGVVERFGKYVLGEHGWRAEWVVIRKLIAPTTEIGLQLEAKFPDVEVVYGDR